MSCHHVPPELESQGLALACQVFPQSDLSIECLRPNSEGDKNNR